MNSSYNRMLELIIKYQVVIREENQNSYINKCTCSLAYQFANLRRHSRTEHHSRTLIIFISRVISLETIGAFQNFKLQGVSTTMRNVSKRA